MVGVVVLEVGVVLAVSGGEVKYSIEEPSITVSSVTFSRFSVDGSAGLVRLYHLHLCIFLFFFSRYPISHVLGY